MIVLRTNPIRFFCLLLSFLVLGCSSSEDENASPNDTNGNEVQNPISDSVDLPEGRINFTHSPIDLNGVAAYEPMGNFRVLPSNHGGFFHAEIGSDNASIEIYAPADGYIILASNFDSSSGLDDFAMVIQHSTTIQTRYGHVGMLSSRLTNLLGNIPKGTVRELFENPISVTAGEVLGIVSIGSALDFGVVDREVSSQLCNTDFLPEEDTYAADMFDYYQGAVRDALLAVNLRQSPPFGGRVGYCAPETLAGNWYLETINEFFEVASHLTIGYSHLYPERIEISDGHSREIEGHNFWVGWWKNNIPAPENITSTDGLVKVELVPKRSFNRISNEEYSLFDISDIDDSPVEATYLLELLDENTLRVERFEGMTADAVSGFTANARTYVRFL